MEILKISQKAQKIIDRYFNLQIGNKDVIAPYYMNLKKQRGGLRVMVGKGTPEEIELEIKVWAQLKGFDIENANKEQVREFMQTMGIGIDCSGFAVYVINAELESRDLSPIWNYLNYKKNGLLVSLKRTLRPVENIGANLLTNDDNCIKIENYNEILPADLIRAKGKQKNAHHVAIITNVVKDDEGNTKEFEYVNSHRYYQDQCGIRIGRVVITDPTKDLLKQEWHDYSENGKNYFLEDLEVQFEDNGIRRLNILNENPIEEA